MIIFLYCMIYYILYDIIWRKFKNLNIHEFKIFFMFQISSEFLNSGPPAPPPEFKKSAEIYKFKNLWIFNFFKEFWIYKSKFVFVNFFLEGKNNIFC